MFEGSQWVAKDFGEPAKVIERITRKWSEPREGHVLVKVLAAGAGLPDSLMVKGVYPLVKTPPATPGQEVCGEVVATAANSPFTPGQRVMGITDFVGGSGGFADYAYVLERRCRPVPSTLSDTEASGFLIPFHTASSAFVVRTRLVAGETVVILGAGGSSGAAAVQFAKALGARVIAVAGGTEKLEFCTAQGADHVIDYRSENLTAKILEYSGGAGADVIFDPVGGETATAAVKAIARHGRIALIGFASGGWLQLDPVDMVLRNYSAVGVFAGGFSPAEDAQAYDGMCRMAEQGQLRTPIAQIYSFEDVPALLARIDGGPPAGKLVVEVSRRANAARVADERPVPDRKGEDGAGAIA